MNRIDTAEHDTELLGLQALICQALSDPKRLRILYLIADREVSVGDLAAELRVSIANVSQHLSLLKARGLVRSRRDGNSVLYGLTHPEIMTACEALKAVLALQLADRRRLSGLLEGSGR